jgi:hypothetical protein
MKQFYIYLHFKPDSTPFYVGKGSGGRGNSLHPSIRYHNKWHQRIVEKYGKENITIDIIPCIDESEAFEQEQLFISMCRNQGHVLCNLTDGGEGPSGYKQSEEEKEKHRQANLNKKRTPEQIENIRHGQLGHIAWNKGKPSPLKGKKRKPESIEKGRIKSTGKKRTLEQNERNRQTHIGKKLSPESIVKREATRKVNRLASKENKK